MKLIDTIKGLPVCEGIVNGRAKVINNPDELGNIEDGEIVVLPQSHPMYALAVMKAAGLICENGGKLSHICIVSMEMGIPCITQVSEATRKIRSGNYVTMDASSGEIKIHE